MYKIEPNTLINLVVVHACLVVKTQFTNQHAVQDSSEVKVACVLVINR